MARVSPNNGVKMLQMFISLLVIHLNPFMLFLQKEFHLLHPLLQYTKAPKFPEGENQQSDHVAKFPHCHLSMDDNQQDIATFDVHD